MADLAYQVERRVVSSIKSADTMIVHGPGGPVELPIALFQVLMEFAEPRTVRDAFDALELDVDLDRFAQIIDELVAGQLLRAVGDDDAPSLGDVLNPAIFGDPARLASVRDALHQGRAIVIPDALPAELAERAHAELDRSTRWRFAEGGHDFFHYRTCGIDDVAAEGPALAEASRLFRSTATRRFIASLADRDCAGEAGIAAAWYRPGEYALPHDDLATTEPRAVAYIWYLTRPWQQAWGGALFWCPTGQYVLPRFNALTIFQVRQANVHMICPVAPSATAKRLTLHGFWHRAAPDETPRAIASDAVVSPRADGAATDASGLLVL